MQPKRSIQLAVQRLHSIVLQQVVYAVVFCAILHYIKIFKIQLTINKFSKINPFIENNEQLWNMFF